MPSLPNDRNPLLVAHLYTDNPLVDTKDASFQKQICYVVEENVNIERERKCTVSVNLRGVNELTCSLNVNRFILKRSECQWIQFMVYVDDKLLPELSRDYKYTEQDIKRSAGEILSPTFKLEETMGKIILVIKTHGPGKKWPDYSFIFHYSRAPFEQLAPLMPAPFAQPESRRFRDVEKKAEILVDKFMELQYAADDRILQKKLLEEAAKAPATKSTEVADHSLLYDEDDTSQGRKRRAEIIRVTPEPATTEERQIVFTFDGKYGEESRRRFEFEERWNALCKEVGAGTPAPSQTRSTLHSLTSSSRPKRAKGEARSSSPSIYRSALDEIDPQSWSRQASIEKDIQGPSHEYTSKSNLPQEIKPLPAPKMRNMTIITRSARRRQR